MNKLLDSLHEKILKSKFSEEVTEAEIDALVEAKEHNVGWISCSDKLPPQPKENPLFDNKALELYLVSDGYSDYPFRAFWNGKFFVDGFSSVDVIAWQPLPTPYQPKGEQG